MRPETCVCQHNNSLFPFLHWFHPSHFPLCQCIPCAKSSGVVRYLQFSSEQLIISSWGVLECILYKNVTTNYTPWRTGLRFVEERKPWVWTRRGFSFLTTVAYSSSYPFCRHLDLPAPSCHTVYSKNSSCHNCLLLFLCTIIVPSSPDFLTDLSQTFCFLLVTVSGQNCLLHSCSSIVPMISTLNKTNTFQWDTWGYLQNFQAISSWMVHIWTVQCIMQPFCSWIPDQCECMHISATYSSAVLYED